MALLDYALTTVADVKAYRQINVSSYDTLLEKMINGATRWIENYLGGRRIKAPGADVTEYYDGDIRRKGRRRIYLKSYPVISIASISYSLGDNYANPTWQAYDAAFDFIVDKETGEIEFTAPLSYDKKSIKVVYQGGYATIPEDISLACMMLVAKVFDKRKSMGVNTEGLGGGNVSWETGDYFAPFGLNMEIRSLLDPYRSFTFA